MNDVRTWFAAGGWVMVALSAVGMVLCFLILERLLAIGARIRAVESSGGRLAGPAAGPIELAGLRRVGLIRACIVIAPLLGLLGTVTGMIETFETILRGGYITEMSDGIRKALLTTQYGLAIAAPGLLAERVVLRRLERLTRLAGARPPTGAEDE